MTWQDAGADGQGGGSAVRLVILIVASVLVANVLLALLIERDSGLGLDEVLAVGSGVGAALAVEYGVFRRRGRDRARRNPGS